MQSLKSMAWTAGAATVGLSASWLLYSRFAIDHDLPLEPAIDAERRTLHLDGFGTVAYYQDLEGEGRPLVLVHSVNAAASAAEMRTIFERYRGVRPVVALDLPGFGTSARPDVPYTPELLAGAVEEVLRAISNQLGEEMRSDVASLSLGCELVARAALAVPGQVATLTLLSPTGFDTGDLRAEPGAGPQDLARKGLSGVLGLPWVGQASYDALVTRPSLRYFLAEVLGREPTHDLVEYAYRTAHQPGARFAPIAFLRGDLFTPDAIGTLYRPLLVPTLVLYDRDPFSDFSALAGFVATHASFRARRISGGHAMPHVSAPRGTFDAMDAFWRVAEVIEGEPAADDAVSPPLRLA